MAISTESLTRAFDSYVALDGLSLAVPEGEVLALLGPNGAGKTTTVRLLNGVLAPSAGRSHVLGHDPAIEPEAVRRLTGVLTEQAGLDDRLTATENLLASARIRGIPDDDARRRIGTLLERFGMSERADVQVTGASTGQRKRIALARSLIHDPEMLFLDEPTSGLDPAAIRDVVGLIRTQASEHGRTIVLCTHFLGEADELATLMAVLHKGRLEAFGRPAELAAGLWHGLKAQVTLGGPARPDLLATIRSVRGVTSADPSMAGMDLVVVDGDVIPQVVSELVQVGAQVFAAVPRPPTLEDVYFEIERRRDAREDPSHSASPSAVEAAAAR